MIRAKASTSYTSLTIANKWNVTNSGSTSSCCNFGDHAHSKFNNTKCQDRIDTIKNKWEEYKINKSRGGGNYERRKFGGCNRSNNLSNNGGTNASASGEALSGVSCKNGQCLIYLNKTNGNGQKR